MIMLELKLDMIRSFENVNKKVKIGQHMELLEVLGLTILDKSNEY